MDDRLTTEDIRKAVELLEGKSQTKVFDFDKFRRPMAAYDDEPRAKEYVSTKFLKKRDLINGRHLRIQEPVTFHDLINHEYQVVIRLTALIAHAEEQVIEEALIDEAKRMGITDLYILNREWVRKAILNEMEYRLVDGCCPSCHNPVSSGGNYCPLCGQHYIE